VHSARVPKPATPAIAVAASSPDPTGFVSIIGHTYRKAKVRLALQSNGVILQTIRADANGWFGFNTTVGYGRTSLRLFETAPGHTRTSMILPVVRVLPQANPAPGTPPTSNNSPGTSGASQTGSQWGNLSTLEKTLLDSSELRNQKWVPCCRTVAIHSRNCGGELSRDATLPPGTSEYAQTDYPGGSQPLTDFAPSSASGGWHDAY
jgi:hypothetical protein